MGNDKSELRKLAEFVHSLTWDRIPPEVRQAAHERTLDLISVAVGASGDGLVKRMAHSYEARNGNGPCHVWGDLKTYPVSTAVMLNGMLAHTLELDDVHSASKTHGSASLIPAAWGCAEYLGKSGKDFLTSVAAGYEVVTRIGMALGVSAHRNRGWHATSTCGVFGCAAACASLLGLDVEGVLSALGMAGTQSCGVWAFLQDGSSCKILHTGRAAANGLEAAFLAKAGMTGPEHIMEGNDGGLLYAMSDGGDASRLSFALGEEWEILKMDTKPYPCCRSTHCAIDCALKLRDCLDVKQIAQIRIATYLVGYKQCAVSNGCLHPESILDAKFSTPYAVAAALIYGKVTMEEYEEKAFRNPGIQKLIPKIQVMEDERFTSRYPEHWGCEMSITMLDGTEYCHKVTDPLGSPAVPVSRVQAAEKAKELLKAGYPGKEQMVVDQILGLEYMGRLPVLGECG